MHKPIDLGKKLSDSIEVRPMALDDQHYPDLYIGDTDDRRLAEMPDQGEATIKYKVISRTHREEGKGKSKKYSCSLRLEITSIDPPEGRSKKKNGDSDGGLRKAMNGYFKDK